MTRRAPFTQDQLLDHTGFPGPVTPQVPQDRVRQTYRGGPAEMAPFRSSPTFPAPGSSGGAGCSDCKLPPIGMGALPAGAFAGAIGMMLGIRSDRPKYVTPGTLTPWVAEDAGLGKGGGHPHHHHGGGGGGRGGSWFGPVEYVDRTYVVDNTNPCPANYYWDPTALRCMKIPQSVLRGIALRGLGSTGGDICTVLNAGMSLVALAEMACPCGTNPVTPAQSAALTAARRLPGYVAATTGPGAATDATGCAICKALMQAAIALEGGICGAVTAATAREAQRKAALVQAQIDAGNNAAAGSLALSLGAGGAGGSAAPQQTNYVPWIIGAAVVGAAVWFLKK